MGRLLIARGKISDQYTVLRVHGFPGGPVGEESACNAGDTGSVSGSGRSPGEGNGSPLQYSCLENPMDGGAWQATVHGVTKSWTQLSDFISFKTRSGSGSQLLKHTADFQKNKNN